MDDGTRQPDPWRVVGASVRGVSHRKSNLPCQDVLLHRALPGGTLVAALADGAGSASLAEVGAQTAARAALDTLAGAFSQRPRPDRENDLREMVLESLRQARAAVTEEASRRHVRLRELATTLVIAVFARTRVVAGQIGDGTVVIADAPDQYALLTRPWPSEHLNETVFLTADNALEQAQVAVQPGPVRHAAMLCDGLQLLALKYPDLRPHHGFFAPLFGFVEACPDPADAAAKLERFLTSPRVTARTDDDLSLLLAVSPRVPPEDPTRRLEAGAGSNLTLPRGGAGR